MKLESLYTIISDSEVALPSALTEMFLAFVAQNGMPFAPVTTAAGEQTCFKFLMQPNNLKGLVSDFFHMLEPDDYAASEIAVPNTRIKHAERIGEESGWLTFVRHQGVQKSRICFIRTSRAVPFTELEERVQLVS